MRAQIDGRVPGKPGPKISVIHSKGGSCPELIYLFVLIMIISYDHKPRKNGARDARRQAKKMKHRPAATTVANKTLIESITVNVKHRKRRNHEHTGAVSSPMKKPSGFIERTTLHLIEVCASPGSILSNEWARRGRAAVRISYRRSGMAYKAPPEPKLGRALTW